VLQDGEDVNEARVDCEQAASWLRLGMMPFSQIHGHESVWRCPQNRFRRDTSDEVRALTTVDHECRCSWVTIGDQQLCSVDAKLDDSWSTSGRRPLTLDVVAWYRDQLA